MKSAFIMSLAIVLCTAGCSKVQLYNSKGKSIGFPIYEIVPHLLVTNKGASLIGIQDKTKKIGDLKPTYGLGSIEWSITRSATGAVTGISAKVDPQADELIKAAADALNALENAAPGVGLYRIEIDSSGTTIVTKVNLP